MNPTDEMAVKKEPTKSAGAVAGSDDVLHKPDERLRAILKNLERTSDQRKPVEDSHSSDVELNQQLDDLPRPSPQRKFAEDVQNFLSQISHQLDNETSERTTIYHRLQAIENEVKKRGFRGFARYLVAICIGVAATLAWQSYGEAAKQMIASWVQQLGWTKPPADLENTAARSSVTETPQAAPVAQATPENITPKAPAAASLDQQQLQQIEANIAAVQQTVEQRLAAMRGTVEQLAVGQDQVLREIAKLNQEILEKIPAPPPPRPIVGPARKPTPTAPASSRRPIPLQVTPHP
jgi:hypothetical protein